MSNQTGHSTQFIRNEQFCSVELRYSHYRQQAFAKHTHDTFSIGVVMEGQTEFFCHNQMKFIQGGEIALINPGEVHACNPQAGSALTYTMLYIEPKLMKDVAAAIVLPEFTHSIVRDKTLFRRLLALNMSLVNGQDNLEIQTSVYETLVTIIQRYGNIRPKQSTPLPAANRLIENGRSFLIDHLYQNISLDELAAHTGLSPYHFLREFRKQYGLPPHAYQLQQRINSAKRLLAQGNPIAHVAVDVGFADQSHFTRKFKSLVGATPRQYQSART